MIFILIFNKTKEMVVDYQRRPLAPITIRGQEVERVDCYRYLVRT